MRFWVRKLTCDDYRRIWVPNLIYKYGERFRFADMYIMCHCVTFCINQRMISQKSMNKIHIDKLKNLLRKYQTKKDPYSKMVITRKKLHKNVY